MRADSRPHPGRYATNGPVGNRQALLRRIPFASEVLDIGCWSGSLGDFLMRDRGATLDGVEPDAVMADVAAERYRRVYNSSIEETLGRLLVERRQGYDSLLYLDVLEHLVAPTDVLNVSRALVRPGGTALVSIPNVAHWSLRASLVRGRWRYGDSGLLDRTHLHFFTHETARELICASGWEVRWSSCDVDGRPFVPQGDRFSRLLGLWPELFAVQFLFEIAIA